jgi:RNA polymerase sigma-70 factor (ECF subfamily)
MAFDESIESELASRAKAGDPAAFDELVRRGDRQVVELSARLCTEAADAEDVRQLAWIRVWQRIADFDERARFTTWAFRIVVNLCRDRERERARRAALHAVELDDARVPTAAPGPEELAQRAELAASVRAALAALPPDERECLVLRHFHGRSTSEIAAIVGRPRTTVQSGLARALTRLQFRLRPFVAEEPRAAPPETRTLRESP